MRLYLTLLMTFSIAACSGSGDSTTEAQQPASQNSPATGSVTVAGEALVGSELTATNTLEDSNGLGTFSYQWFSGSNAIAGATESTYVITNSEVGEVIYVSVSFRDGDNNTEQVDSARTAAVSNTTLSNSKNVLLIIADDLGVDASAQYSFSSDTPLTPTLDSLASNGIVFDNVWATPACTTTRGTIMTGKHGVNSGISFVPAAMSADEDTLLKRVSNIANYTTALMGKWHLGGPSATALHPLESGAGTYAGFLNAAVDNYYSWDFTQNGATNTSTEYNTSKTTDLAIDWINQQDSSWLLWVAYAAPHSPFHLPPTQLHARTALTGTDADIDANRRDYYLAAIEAMDTEIGRLLGAMSPQERDNTLVIFIGDNGTPARVIDRDVFIGAHSKGSLYEGGIRVPMIVSGNGVTRQNERDAALVNSTDLFATILSYAGEQTMAIHDSVDFSPLFSAQATSPRQYNYSEFESGDVTGWAVRDTTHKLIEYEDSSQELFATEDISETNNLLGGATDYSEQITQLRNFALQVRGESPKTPEDITQKVFTNTSHNCGDYVNVTTSSVTDINNNVLQVGDLRITVANGKCQFRTNAIPNHDYNDGSRNFPNTVSPQDDLYEISTDPTFANNITALSLRQDNAILLNGVKVDLLAAGCFGIGDGKVGCNDVNTPWRFDPMFEANGFAVDSHNAHSQGDGTYHYHGKPEALYNDDNSQASAVIGFAADGFPIFGPYINDNSVIRKAASSYQLKSGDRPTTEGSPGGIYDGSYRDDWEFIEGLGDLDECNGMTTNGMYAYYITDTFPHVIACFKGTPDASFIK